MFAAARWTDIITHDMVTPCGIIGPPISGPAPGGLVLVENLPAAYVTCQCVCTGVIAAGIAHIPVPGPQPPIIMGSMTVLINKLPAARWAPSGDMGALGEQLGYLPMLPMRRTFLGGASGPTAALPFTVNRLPDGRIQVGDHIFIEGTPEFQSQVLTDMAVLAATPTGLAILNGIDGGTHNTTIRELDMARAQRNGALATRVDQAGSVTPGQGSDTIIQYNPDVNLPMTDADGNTYDWPPPAILGHEMIHAVHNDTGDNLRNVPDPADPTGNQEESQTIGINDHAGDATTENNLLDDLGTGFRRTDHDLTAAPHP